MKEPTRIAIIRLDGSKDSLWVYDIRGLFEQALALSYVVALDRSDGENALREITPLHAGENPEVAAGIRGLHERLGQVITEAVLDRREEQVPFGRQSVPLFQRPRLTAIETVDAINAAEGRALDDIGIMLAVPRLNERGEGPSVEEYRRILIARVEELAPRETHPRAWERE